LIGRLILALALGLSSDTASRYGDLIDREAARYGIEPELVIAVIHAESRFRAWARSRTNDYGLGQLHVSSTTRPEYVGREHLLYDPALNIRLTVRALRMWRVYHRRRCSEGSHHWVSHYNQGTRVFRLRYERKVLRTYRRLRDRADSSYW